MTLAHCAPIRSGPMLILSKMSCTLVRFAGSLARWLAWFTASTGWVPPLSWWVAVFVLRPCILLMCAIDCGCEFCVDPVCSLPGMSSSHSFCFSSSLSSLSVSAGAVSSGFCLPCGWVCHSALAAATSITLPSPLAWPRGLSVPALSVFSHLFSLFCGCPGLSCPLVVSWWHVGVWPPSVSAAPSLAFDMPSLVAWCLGLSSVCAV